MKKKNNKVVIIGGGPTGLMCAHQLAKIADLEIHVYDAQKTFGRKLLVAGNGGFNLTHSEPINEMIAKYKNLPAWFEQAIIDFDNQSTIQFIEKDIGIETFIGSSNRIFPKKGIKPANMLKRWLYDLESKGVHLHTHKKMIDFDHKMIAFEDGSKIHFDFLVIALGGISWSKTGSDGNWLNLFEQKNIPIKPFSSSNVGTLINWPKSISDKYNRAPIKFVKVKVADFEITGDLMLTPYGLEGTPVYASTHFLKHSTSLLQIDFKPLTPLTTILKKLKTSSKSISKTLKEDIKLDTVVVDLIKAYSNKETFQDPIQLAQLIKNFPLPTQGLRPIEEAISSAGGVKWSNLNQYSALNNFPNIFLGGEMLDWDAPTGGYLLQACFSSGAFVAKNIQNSIYH